MSVLKITGDIAAGHKIILIEGSAKHIETYITQLNILLDQYTDYEISGSINSMGMWPDMYLITTLRRK